MIHVLAWAISVVWGQERIIFRIGGQIIRSQKPSRSGKRFLVLMVRGSERWFTGK